MEYPLGKKIVIGAISYIAVYGNDCESCVAYDDDSLCNKLSQKCGLHGGATPTVFIKYKPLTKRS